MHCAGLKAITTRWLSPSRPLSHSASPLLPLPSPVASPLTLAPSPKTLRGKAVFTFKWQLWRQRLLLSLLQLSCGDGSSSSCHRGRAGQMGGPGRGKIYSKWVTGPAINKQSARQSHSNSSAVLTSQKHSSFLLFSMFSLCGFLKAATAHSTQPRRHPQLS